MPTSGKEKVTFRYKDSNGTGNWLLFPPGSDVTPPPPPVVAVPPPVVAVPPPPNPQPPHPYPFNWQGIPFLGILQYLLGELDLGKPGGGGGGLIPGLLATLGGGIFTGGKTGTGTGGTGGPSGGGPFSGGTGNPDGIDGGGWVNVDGSPAADPSGSGDVPSGVGAGQYDWLDTLRGGPEVKEGVSTTGVSVSPAENPATIAAANKIANATPDPNAQDSDPTTGVAAIDARIWGQMDDWLDERGGFRTSRASDENDDPNYMGHGVGSGGTINIVDPLWDPIKELNTSDGTSAVAGIGALESLKRQIRDQHAYRFESEDSMQATGVGTFTGGAAGGIINPVDPVAGPQAPAFDVREQAMLAAYSNLATEGVNTVNVNQKVRAMLRRR